MKTVLFMLTVTDGRKGSEEVFNSLYSSMDAAKVSMYIDIIRVIGDSGFDPFKDIQWHNDFCSYSAPAIGIKWEIKKVPYYYKQVGTN